MAGQKPSLTPSTLALAQDPVAREVFGVGYSSLTTSQKADLTTEGEAAFTKVTAIGKWYADVEPSTEDLPTEYNELFRAMWAALGIRRFRSVQDYHIYTREYVLPLEQRIADHYTANWDAGTFLATDEITPGKVRNAVITVLIRQRTPIYPPIKEIDESIREEFVEIWNERAWEFKRRAVQLTLDTNGDVLVAGDYIFDGMASKSFVIKLTDGAMHDVNWVDSTRHTRLAAYYAGKTGRPRAFYDIDEGTIKSVQLIPTPDIDYTAYADILIAAPSFAGLASSAGIKHLPAEFRGHLKDSVVARMMSKFGREDGDAQRLMRDVRMKREEIASKWDEKGASRHTARGHHQQKFTNDLASNTYGTNIIGQW